MLDSITQAIWFEDPMNVTDKEFNIRLVSVYFIDVDAGLEAIKESIVDAKIPYKVVTPKPGEEFIATQNHMVS